MEAANDEKVKLAGGEKLSVNVGVMSVNALFIAPSFTNLVRHNRIYLQLSST